MAYLEWERIKDSKNTLSVSEYGCQIERAKIPGGWLVRTKILEGGGITFVPDPKHEWK